MSIKETEIKLKFCFDFQGSTQPPKVLNDRALSWDPKRPFNIKISKTIIIIIK